jgi:cob(I)alamin adenosyltransferase
MKIYTLTGDDGTTSLSGGKRVPKHCLRVEAYGSVDELIAWIGLLRGYKENIDRKDFLIYIQYQLMTVAATLSGDPSDLNSKPVLPDPECVHKVETEIDAIDGDLPVLKSFLLPGGQIIVSNCHIARCVCRRAERAVLRLKDSEDVPRIVVEFLNRLSDYLFVLSRKLSLDHDNEEITWSSQDI